MSWQCGTKLSRCTKRSPANLSEFKKPQAPWNDRTKPCSLRPSQSVGRKSELVVICFATTLPRSSTATSNSNACPPRSCGCPSWPASWAISRLSRCTKRSPANLSEFKKPQAPWNDRTKPCSLRPSQSVGRKSELVVICFATTLPRSSTATSNSNACPPRSCGCPSWPASWAISKLSRCTKRSPSKAAALRKPQRSAKRRT
mmetsp:Transcript_103098/g.292026  ORF Transcript_103098/g.292026 Transcript_103098/m.292026 type:complete len:201 (+) Transcript_103098:1784-2386(+)